MVADGRIVAAVEEERLRRVKHWAGFPTEAIRCCLDQTRISIEDVSHIAVNRNSRANLLQKLGYTLQRRPDVNWLVDRIRKNREKSTILDELQAMFPQARVNATLHPVEHHFAHLASAFFVSAFDEAVVVSVDGFGDFASAAWGIGIGTKIEVEDRIYFPHSLGIFYEATTQFLGFPHWGDEYKVMGLAPYGTPKYLELFEQIVLVQEDGSYRLNLEYFRHHRENIASETFNGSPSTGTLYSAKIEQLLGHSRRPGEDLTQHHKDLARSAQAMYEKAFFNLVNKLHERHPYEHLALAGGCAMNSVANGRIYANTPFRKIYIQAATGDAGGAIGAAIAVWHTVLGESARFSMDHAYWGPEFSPQTIRQIVEAHIARLDGQNCKVEWVGNHSHLRRLTAEAIAQGKVIGWFQGRMEWGPRALGNRSILCDPRRANMKDILNSKIKRRESFRPFAPSILREQVRDWFETEDEVPFMMQVFQVRPEKRRLIPAVTHIDGSGRLQTVYRKTNPRYYELIEEFYALTGVPLVLNTSFNENEPVVCRPEEALDCFLRTKMDVLVLGDCFISREVSSLDPTDSQPSGEIVAV
ncbi:MAG: carbamoyltransferase [Verrucomicrobiales bacterium]|nr:carbamoyltransferase [Verrucomicrobiales bacterium]